MAVFRDPNEAIKHTCQRQCSRRQLRTTASSRRVSQPSGTPLKQNRIHSLIAGMNFRMGQHGAELVYGEDILSRINREKLREKVSLPQVQEWAYAIFYKYFSLGSCQTRTLCQVFIRILVNIKILKRVIQKHIHKQCWLSSNQTF